MSPSHRPEPSLRLAPRKHLGQHFLTDKHVVQRMVQALGPLDEATIIEIGPGQGALSFPIWQSRPLSYIGLEADARCVTFLRDSPWFKDQDSLNPSIQVHHQDALTCPIHTWNGQKTVISNLPYHISTQILCSLLPYCAFFQQFVFMFQREVAERIMAQPGTKAYGRLSVMTQAVADVKLLCHVKAGAFFPPPKVDSSVLILKPLKRPWIEKVEDWFVLEALVKQAFSQRRKQLKNNLKNWPSTPSLSKLLNDLGIHHSQRPETLTISQFVALSRHHIMP